MGQKIDGSALAETHKLTLINKLRALGDKRKPGIVSFCNTEDTPSVKYTAMKKQKAEEIGISFLVEDYNTQTLHEELEEKVKKYNLDSSVDGIMVQLPVPLELVVFQQDLLNLIDPQKDVDGLTQKGQEIYQPATVKSVISILEWEVKGWKELKIAVVGSEGEIGQPLVHILNTQFLIHNLVQVDRTKGDVGTDLKGCKIIVSCVGHQGLIRPEMVMRGSVLIDVGLGDFDPGCFDQSSKYTGRYGGVGPMTVISLMENVVEAFEKRLKEV